MAQYDGSIRINTQLNTRGFERGARGLLSGMERLGNSLRGIIGSLGFGLGIAGLIALGKQAIDTASDIEEVQNVVDTAFGSMAYRMEEFASTAIWHIAVICKTVRLYIYGYGRVYAWKHGKSQRYGDKSDGTCG